MLQNKRVKTESKNPNSLKYGKSNQTKQFALQHGKYNLNVTHYNWR